jgi:hypothetical protein
MKFFFPDSHDLVDPSFDFVTERRTYSGSRQQAQLYAHEVLDQPPYDGMLVSKAVIDGRAKNVRYSFAQVQRLKRVGVREFLRLEAAPGIATMGDCGSFTYVAETEPPFTVQEVADFYLECQFDFGLSLDHVVLGYADDDAKLPPEVLEEYRRRWQLTLDLARDFLRLHTAAGFPFTLIGIAQGWSPASYAKAVSELQRIGYDYIALGGMVPLKTPEILASLEAVKAVRAPGTKLHLLGIGRFDRLGGLDGMGVHSFDSTAPLKQAFMDDRDNYYARSRTYTAVRIPQVSENPQLKRRILAGEIDHERARLLERQCFQAALAYNEDSGGLERLLGLLAEYEQLWNRKPGDLGRYRETLRDRPWRDCGCSICRRLGIHVILFRGAERNRRRGFHNLHVVCERLHGLPARALADAFPT